MLTEAGSASSLVVGGDLGDPSREVDVLLGHPLDDVFGALVVAVDGVVGDQLEVDVPVADRHARVVAERVARLAHRGDEPRGGAEVVDQVASMESLGQLAPVGQVRLGDLVALQHVHSRGPYLGFSRSARAHRFARFLVLVARGAGMVLRITEWWMPVLRM
jgi:hypothetical protein